MTNLLPPVPFQSTITDSKNPGFLPAVWADWFKQLFIRVGQSPATAFTLQSVVDETVDSVNGMATIPFDDTIPQNSEGTEILTASITPRSESNKIRIEAILNVSSSAAGRQIIATLFQDDIVDAIGAAWASVSDSNGGVTLLLRHEVVASSLEARTYKVRFGADSAAIVTLNGSAGMRVMGGVAVSSLVLTEIAT